MRINEHVAVSTPKVDLVPYSAHHVPKYHGWMGDPDIREATASDPLTMEEEYAMQQSWRTDADKLTFIVCRPGPPAAETRNGSLDVDSMIGDVNLFISTTDPDSEPARAIGELELMIAEKDQHRQGYGRGAVVAFTNYIMRHEEAILAEFGAHVTASGAANMPPSQFDHLVVKIGAANLRSIALFESLGYKKTSASPSYFGEFELRLGRDDVARLLKSDVWDTLDGYRETVYVYP